MYNPNIHHRKSIRLKGYDYSQAGLYFITICCHNRICRFGHIENGKMILNDAGQIAHHEWLNTSNIRSNVELGNFIVMPNHIHGIIRLFDRGELHSPELGYSTNKSHLPDLDSRELNPGECSSPLRGPSQTIGAIVRGYKSSVTKHLGLMGMTDKIWQRNYHEHIIRNEMAYLNISTYITNNPLKWPGDTFFNR